MKSAATPHYLSLQCVRDTPSFLYALTSLMSPFLFDFWCMLCVRFLLVETGDVCFCTSGLANIGARKFKEERVVWCGGENRRCLTSCKCRTLYTRYEIHSTAWSLTLKSFHRTKNQADTGDRAVSGVGLRLLDCRDCVFESCCWHGCLSVVFLCVLQAEASADGRSLVMANPSECVSH